jgi:hypothetical protein
MSVSKPILLNNFKRKLDIPERFIITESKSNWSVIMKEVRKYPQGPFSLVVIKDDKVIHQVIDIRIPDLIPAQLETLKLEYPNTRIRIENGEGKIVWEYKPKK